MVGTVLFPRVDTTEAESLRTRFLANLGPGVEFERSALDEALEDPHAFPATGGARITAGELLALRQDCVAAMMRARAADETRRRVVFDIEVGAALHSAGSESRGEFGDPRVWDFITLVLMPDLAALRLHPGGGTGEHRGSAFRRVTGGDRRHVFQRLWKRWAVFGPEIVRSGRLTEDDYGMMLERLLTRQRRELARAAATAVVNSGYSGSSRREYTREFMKCLLQLSGLVHVRDDDPAQVAALVDRAHSQTLAALG